MRATKPSIGPPRKLSSGAFGVAGKSSERVCPTNTISTPENSTPVSVVVLVSVSESVPGSVVVSNVVDGPTVVADVSVAEAVPVTVVSVAVAVSVPVPGSVVVGVVDWDV